MTILMVVIDGIENADYRHFTSLKNMEIAGYRNNTPKGMVTDSLSCIMGLLGVKKELIPMGRAYLEALALDLDIGDDDLIFRCNLVEVDEHNILTASSKIGKANEIMEEHYYLKHIEKHKYLLVMKGEAHHFPMTTTHLPHQNIGKKIETILPSSSEELDSFLKELVTEQSIFSWGQSIKSATPSFYELHKKTGAIIAKTEIVVGIAKSMKMYCPPLKKATADVDTDLVEKAMGALRLTTEYDFVMLHINGVDESAHRRNKEEKVEFLKRIDEQIIKYLMKNISTNTGLIITADHETSSQTGEHKNSDVCYYIINQNEECSRWLSQL